jgi:ATP-dependent helicase HrpB
MAALGNDPRLAAMLVAARDDEIATAANWRLFLRSRRAAETAIWAGVFTQSETGSSRAQQLCRRLTAVAEHLTARDCPLLAQAFPDRIARRRGLDGRYQLANGMGAMLDSDDALTRHEWLIAPLLQGSHSRMRVSCRRLPSILMP